MLLARLSLSHCASLVAGHELRVGHGEREEEEREQLTLCWAGGIRDTTIAPESKITFSLGK